MFRIGQIFEGTYPPALATWCDNNCAYIAEIEPVDGVRRFQVVAVPEPTPEELAAALQTRYTALIQLWLDEFAQTRGYDHINSACTYATSTDPTFRAEGEYCVALRDATWRTGYALLAEVQAGTRPVPTEDELKALLPIGSAEWPTPNAQAEAAAL